MKIERISYDFKDSNYYINVHDENDVYFKLCYSKRFGIHEDKYYFMNLISKEISNDISTKSTELCGFYVNCDVSGEVDNFETDVKAKLFNYYKQLGYLPSAYDLKDEDIPFVCYISFNEEYLKRQDNKVKEVYKYIFSNWNIKYIICYKNSFNEQNVYDIIENNGQIIQGS